MIGGAAGAVIVILVVVLILWIRHKNEQMRKIYDSEFRDEYILKRAAVCHVVFLWIAPVVSLVVRKKEIIFCC